MCTGQPNADIPSPTLSPGVILECVKLTMKANHHIKFMETEHVYKRTNLFELF